MSCFDALVIGATCDDQINYGETIDLVFTYQDASGPMDLTSATPTIFSSSPPVIQNSAVLEITDAPAGKLRILLHRDDALQLRRGRNNRFRVQMIFGADSDDVTPDIYLQVT